MDKYKIIIIGEAKANIGKNFDTIEDLSMLEQLDGIDCQENFSEYFDGDESYAKDVTGGYMDFKFKDGKLLTYTSYNSNRLLTETELHDLIEYTQGQWGDGIGEGFEQYPCREINGEEVYISPWTSKQEVIALQEINI